MKALLPTVTKTMLIVLLILSAIFASGCYWRTEIDESEVGLLLPDGVTVSSVVSSGRYTDWKYYAKIKQVDISAKTFQWGDPSLVTSDKQQIGFTVGVTYRRSPLPEHVLLMWKTYRAECTDDELLQLQVANRIARVAKNLTADYTLDEMLGVSDSNIGRTDIQGNIFDDLKIELSEVGVELLDIGINDIQPSEQYLLRLEQKADAAVNAEIAKQNTLTKREELLQEEAQTEIAIEIARRDRLVAEEANMLYTQSPQAYELARLRELSNLLGDSDKVYFVPEGSDITLFLGSGSIVPVN